MAQKKAKPKKRARGADVRDKMGRPEKLTPELHTKLVALVRGGTFLDTAAALCRITKPTLRNWLRAGADGIAAGNNNIYTRLVEDIDVADADAEETARDRLQSFVDAGEWKPLVWLMERKWPDRYKPPPQKVENEISLPDELSKKLAEAKKAGAK